MSFRSVFVAIVIAFALILGAFLIQHARPRIEADQPNAAFVRASGKCAECHLRQQYSVVHEYEMSWHGAKGNVVNGAPPFAPLLLPNLSILGLLGIVALVRNPSDS